MELNIEIPRKISLAYGAACKGLCRELDLPQTAFDILMFLGNNPAYKTASEIVERLHIKSNLISVHVDRLLHELYLIRRPSPTDRRKTELFCTEKALPVIRRGRQLQADFLEKVFADTDQETRRAFANLMRRIEENLDGILEGK